MGYAERYVVTVKTAADGTATAYTPVVSGGVAAIHYIKTDFADGVDFTITAEATGETLWTEANVNLSASRYPHAATHKTDGIADGNYQMVIVASDRIKISIAQGGASKTGTFHVVLL